VLNIYRSKYQENSVVYCSILPTTKFQFEFLWRIKVHCKPLRPTYFNGFRTFKVANVYFPDFRFKFASLTSDIQIFGLWSCKNEHRKFKFEIGRQTLGTTANMIYSSGRYIPSCW